jgi:hypothetical protein
VTEPARAEHETNKEPFAVSETAGQQNTVRFYRQGRPSLKSGLIKSTCIAS